MKNLNRRARKKWTGVILVVCLVIGSLFYNMTSVPAHAAVQKIKITPNYVSNVNIILPEATYYYPADDSSSTYSYLFQFTLKSATEVRITGTSRYSFRNQGNTVYTLTNTNASVKEEWKTEVNVDHTWEEKWGNSCDKVFVLNKGTYALSVTTSLSIGWKDEIWSGHTVFDYDRGFWLAVNASTYTGTPTLKSVTNKAKRKIKVKYKAVSKADGYAVQYSTSKKFTKKSSVSSKKTSVNIKKLKKKTYYVRVRAYRLIKDKRYYGAWSNVKKVKVKK